MEADVARLAGFDTHYLVPSVTPFIPQLASLIRLSVNLLSHRIDLFLVAIEDSAEVLLHLVDLLSSIVKQLDDFFNLEHTIAPYNRHGFLYHELAFFVGIIMLRELIHLNKSFGDF